MPSVELTKSIEARKLNPRNRLPLKEPAVMIPFAAILDNIEQDRELARFTYLGQLYHSSYQDLMDASRPMDSPGPEAAPTASEAAADASPEPAPPAASPSPDAPALNWESLNSPKLPAFRAKVPGGWLIAAARSGSVALCFYPDPNHSWNGASMN